MIQGRQRMPPRLAAKTKKLNLILPDELVRRIDAWRGREAGVPNASQAIRVLLERALDAADEADRPKKRK
jgi:Arc/MetJ-type ribon-helix-helix transcriptional regulator